MALMISVEGVTQRRSSGKPKLLLRGARRKAAHKALTSLEVLERRDFDENRRAAVNNYEAMLILGAPNSRWSKAIADLKTRLREVLAAKA